MKNQALFSSKDKSRELKCRLLQFLFGALKVLNYLLQILPSVPVRECFTGLLTIRPRLSILTSA